MNHRICKGINTYDCKMNIGKETVVLTYHGSYVKGSMDTQKNETREMNGYKEIITKTFILLRYPYINRIYSHLRENNRWKRISCRK